MAENDAKQTAAFFELIDSWMNAPTTTASADLPLASSASMDLFNALYRQMHTSTTTTAKEQSDG